MIDPTFTTVNRLFVLSFESEDDRTSFSKYYVPKFELENPDLKQQINFTERHEENNAAICNKKTVHY